MIALEGNFAYSFILGVMAAVNPCGFVLLPTYLVYYLGTELNREGENKTTTLRRGLSVGTAVSSGFIGLFLVVGIISRAFTTVIRDNAKYAALIIGIGLVIMGIAMLFGWKLPIAQPDVSVQRKRTTWNMFLFGIVYAIASIGCTIGLLISVILGSINRHGFVSGVISIVLYGLGMGLLVTSLTVALAFARVGLVSTIKKSFKWFDRISATFVVLTGLYLTWYWLGAITDRGSDGVTSRVEHWQTNVAQFLQDVGVYPLLIVFCVIIATAGFVIRRSSLQNK
ncbi:MAG: cytochrome c biogenesis CcdA family protein [Ilumatobacteraceae bacterium]|jgi:cytochrome c-type biogenesis protein